MRGVGALMLVAVLTAATLVVETRPPPRNKRGIRLCSARDVKIMATYVCNLHRRSVRSVHEPDNTFRSPDAASLVDVSNRPWRSSPCGNTGWDCIPEFDSHPIQSSVVDVDDAASITLADIQRWLSANGYHRMFLPENSNNLWPAKIGMINENADINQDTENGFGRVNYAIPFLGDLRTNMAKRDKELDWPVVAPRSLGDVRKNCCLRECSVEDFYGACS
nr:uncharacterized protein LOC123770275 [Procambarus clarkii]